MLTHIQSLPLEQYRTLTAVYEDAKKSYESKQEPILPLTKFFLAKRGSMETNYKNGIFISIILLGN
jgi:hypothetical protein